MPKTTITIEIESPQINILEGFDKEDTNNLIEDFQGEVIFHVADKFEVSVETLMVKKIVDEDGVVLYEA